MTASDQRQPLDLVFTGPECCGKTTLSTWVASEYQLPLVEEFSRSYLCEQGGKYLMEDLINIARGQDRLASSVQRNSKLVIHDTDLITIIIWALEVFGHCPDVIIDLCPAMDQRIYALVYPDIPWEYDPLRENPEDRLRLFGIYERFLKQQQASYCIIRGSGAARYESTKQLISKVMA